MGAGLVVLDHQRHADNSTKQNGYEKNATQSLVREKSVKAPCSPHIPLLRVQRSSTTYRGKLVLLGLNGAGKSTLFKQLRNVCKDDGVADIQHEKITHNVLHAKAGKTGIFNDEVANETPGRLRWSASSPRPSAFVARAKAKVTSAIIYFDPESAFQLIVVPGDCVPRKTWASFYANESSGHSRSNFSTPTINASSSNDDSFPFQAVIFVVDGCDQIRFPTIVHDIVKVYLDIEMRADRIASISASSPLPSLLILFNKIDELEKKIVAGTSLLQAIRKEFEQCVEHEFNRQFCQLGCSARIKSARSQGMLIKGLLITCT